MVIEGRKNSRGKTNGNNENSPPQGLSKAQQGRTFFQDGFYRI
jgi:hypothetical protein